MLIREHELRRVIREVLSDEEYKSGVKTAKELSNNYEEYKNDDEEPNYNKLIDLHKIDFFLSQDFSLKLKTDTQKKYFYIEVNCQTDQDEVFKDRQEFLFKKIREYEKDFFREYPEITLFHDLTSFFKSLNRENNKNKILFFSKNDCNISYKIIDINNCKRMYLYFYTRLKRDFNIKN